MAGALHLCPAAFRVLLEQQGPSLGLWRAAEVAALRECAHDTARPILDLGCGDGLVTSLVLPRVDVGLDPDTVALAKATRRGLYARVEPVAAEEAALPAQSMATVLSNSVLEHLPHIDAVLHAVGRVLRPGGHLIFTAPTDAFSAQLLVPLPGYAARRNRQYRHRNLWSVERWARHLEQAGLEIERVRPYLRPGLVRAWDALELLQQVWIGRRRLMSLAWRQLSADAFDRMAAWAAALDLSATPPGGGHLIVARKR